MATVRSECAACGRVFGGVVAFDDHQLRTGDTWKGGELICRDPAERTMKDGRPRWKLVEGIWVEGRERLPEAWRSAAERR